ncbi:peptidoglycan-binding domain-containing protein [Streptomyces fulvoviolaceus]|uniref:peptidoglycan-binding domain-containing protein n=1 Tax=Streptomyces fulvoviolaceus TaxID=285535 RepID=UPI0021C09EF8|nr:peptidoglycan-binding domain-containing protein [Streptomyces fulvoviolaceus]MCT9081553.1 peptidoglycan-binding protein [Streptomyces fulvoviolaceus]
MAESNGHLCPECGAPRGADNTPSCGCTERASEALRDARTAEAAAAEDFDPLRIRPYVELEGGAAVQEPPSAADDTTELPAVEATMPLMPLRAADTDSALPTPLAPPATAPSAADLSLFEEGAAPVGESPRRSRRRTALLGVGGALVTVVTAAGFGSGLFTYETPSRDQAAPEGVRAAVPDASPSAASVAPATQSRSAQPTSASPSPSPSDSAGSSPSTSPSASRSSASPSPSGSAAEPTASGSTTSADDSDSARETTPPVLRRGSDGDEVVELELRLTQLGLYTRKASGHYNEGVEDAVGNYQRTRGIQAEEYGVYDLVTRDRLESETTEP